MSGTTTNETEIPNENLLQTVQTSPRQREEEDVKFFKNELVGKFMQKEVAEVRKDKDKIISLLETQLKYEREQNAHRYDELQKKIKTSFQELTECIKDKKCEAPEPAPPQTAPQPPSPPRRDSDWWRCW